MNMVPILVGLVMLAIGVLVGWLFASRAATAIRAELGIAHERVGQGERLRAVLAEAEAERDRLRVDHGRMCEQNDLLRPMRAELEAERDRHAGEAVRLGRELADLAARHEAAAGHHQTLLAELKDVRTSLPLHFGEVAKRALDDAQSAFLKRADDRFRQSEDATARGVKALIGPVETTLKRYEDNVNKLEAERRDAFGLLHGQIGELRLGQERVSAEAAKLVNALRDGPKKRGSWGELQLKNLLESCGLSQHTDFRTEVSVDTDEGRLRPDAVVKIPGGKSLVIDSKVSLNAYQDAVDAVDDDRRNVAMGKHVASMKGHVNTLGAKSYQSQFESLDYVIMFVPGEQFVSAALEHDPTLWEYAFEKKVLIATPANLIAILRTVAAVWRQESIASQAAEIGKLGKELYARLATMAGHVTKLGRNLELATGAYNSFVGSLETQVLTQARRFEALDIDTGGKSIDSSPAVEAHPRALTKLAVSEVAVEPVALGPGSAAAPA